MASIAADTLSWAALTVLSWMLTPTFMTMVSGLTLTLPVPRTVICDGLLLSAWACAVDASLGESHTTENAASTKAVDATILIPARSLLLSAFISFLLITIVYFVFPSSSKASHIGYDDYRFRKVPCKPSKV